MKKTLLIVALAFGLIANAQDFNVKYGVKAGVNVAYLTEAKGDEADSIVSFHVGVLAEFLISDKFSVQPELLYSVQGFKVRSEIEPEVILNHYLLEKLKFCASGIEPEIIFNISYLNLPIMAKYYITKGLSLEAGPEIGFKLNAKAKIKSITLDVGEDIKGVAFGLNFGTAYKLDNGLHFGFRYNLGLTKINEENDDIHFKNRILQFSIGYFFN